MNPLSPKQVRSLMEACSEVHAPKPVEEVAAEEVVSEEPLDEQGMGLQTGLANFSKGLYNVGKKVLQTGAQVVGGASQTVHDNRDKIKNAAKATANVAAQIQPGGGGSKPAATDAPSPAVQAQIAKNSAARANNPDYFGTGAGTNSSAAASAPKPTPAPTAPPAPAPAASAPKPTPAPTAPPVRPAAPVAARPAAPVAKPVVPAAKPVKPAVALGTAAAATGGYNPRANAGVMKYDKNLETKSGNRLAKALSGKTSDFKFKEAYDVVLDHLLSEGHADTVEEAHYIMLQMTPEHVQDILEGA